MGFETDYLNACNRVELQKNRIKRLKRNLEDIKRALTTADEELVESIRSRNAIQSMMTDKPAESIVNNPMQNREAVFSALRRLPNTWLAPLAISIISGVDEKVTGQILREVSKIELIPLKHNGMRGRGSKYTWVQNS